MSIERPLNVLFVITSMPVGGAETLLASLVRQIDRTRFAPSICCLKEPGSLGEILAGEVPLHSGMIGGKFDVSVLWRLVRLMRFEQIDAVITVGAGDKMFWGRLAARLAGVPVILAALHSTGWPDGVSRMNRLLTPITSGFIAVAENHGRFLVEQERFPERKVFVIPNGIDTGRFRFSPECRLELRKKFAIPEFAPVTGIVAALRPEKNHPRFLEIARRVLSSRPDAYFVIAGDGPERESIVARAAAMGLTDRLRMTGSTSDVPGVLAMLDVFALSSDNEASPVSILEAMSCGRPVVAPNVGSISQSVLQGTTGFVFEVDDIAAAAEHWLQLLNDPDLAGRMGTAGRDWVVERASLAGMTRGYEDLIGQIFGASAGRTRRIQRVTTTTLPAEPGALQ